MLITGTFGDRAAQQAILKVEHDTFKPLKAHGIYDFAHSAYERYADALGIEKTQHTQNAYLLQFSNLAIDNGYMDSFQLDGIEVFLRKRFAATYSIKKNGTEYLRSLGHNAPPSDDLLAAGMLTPPMKSPPDKMTMVCLVGQDTVDFVAAHDFLLKHRSLDFRGDFTPEANTLHLAQMTAFTKNCTNILQLMKAIRSSDPAKEINDANFFLECMQNINPAPRLSRLEYNAYKEMRALENLLPEIKKLYANCLGNAVEPPSPNIHSI